MSQRLFSIGHLAVLLFIVVAIAFSSRIAWIAGEQMQLAEQMNEAGNSRRAIIAYERAIHAYLPWLPAHRDSVDGMQALNEALEAKGDKILALEGWRRLRGGLLSTRSMFGQPDQDTLLEANHNIARLTALTDVQDKRSKKEIEHEVAELLEAFPKDISAFWGVMQFMLLLLWIGSTTWLIWNWAGFAVRQRMLAGSVSALSLMGWLGALYLAG